LRTFCLTFILIFFVQLPSVSQEASALGLKGPVYTVLTEEFDNQNGASHESSGSTFDVYDRKGYLLELYRYNPDGSLWAHTIYSRKGEQIFKSQTTGATPSENFSVLNFYDADGHIVETNTFNADGVLTKKTKNEFLENRPESTTYRSIESSVEGTENTREIVESTDPKTGLTHQIATMNGEPETDWVIQRDGNGVPQKDKIILADGSYNEREREADGTTVEDIYSASSKSHTYQKTDAQGHLIEVVDKSGSSYLRWTYSFDKDGRPTGQINYGAAGEILDKSTIEYHDDSFGNWTEKKIVLWDTASEPMKRKLVATSLRTITYF
jgi:hypothetical protein